MNDRINIKIHHTNTSKLEDLHCDDGGVEAVPAKRKATAKTQRFVTLTYHTDDPRIESILDASLTKLSEAGQLCVEGGPPTLWFEEGDILIEHMSWMALPGLIAGSTVLIDKCDARADIWSSMTIEHRDRVVFHATIHQCGCVNVKMFLPGVWEAQVTADTTDDPNPADERERLAAEAAAAATNNPHH